MKLAKQSEYYDDLWSERKRMNSLKLMRAIKILDYFVVAKKKFKNPRTLDLGCGDGRFTAFLGEFADADGLELSTEAVKIANSKHPHVSYFYGDAVDYDFGSNIYDVVVSQEVIEHIEDQEAYISVCYNVLKAGGYLIMTTPNKKVFDHMKGGNWSSQPIEKVLTPQQFKKLVQTKFDIIAYDSIIFNFGKLGYFKIVNSRLLVGLSNRLGFNKLREFFLSKWGFGLHQCVLAKKKS
ncbi:class I SAM-dependent methyltransferase [Bizionia psychrotolerans]|uniref:class I SAM-dependent methyltransferase n=1 Tax=Bizionia psychrotolerans TaxID=1492901 RepID=UPI000650C9CE|nr:class I SAM-dependent methyltransferase [Bizionia psychrotolerans]